MIEENSVLENQIPAEDSVLEFTKPDFQLNDCHTHVEYSIPFKTTNELEMSLDFELPRTVNGIFKPIVCSIMHNDNVIGTSTISKTKTLLDVLSNIWKIPQVNHEYEPFKILLEDESTSDYAKSDAYLTLLHNNRSSMTLWDVLVDLDIQEILKRCDTYKIHTELDLYESHQVNYIVKTPVYEGTMTPNEIKNTILRRLFKTITKSTPDAYYPTQVIELVNTIFDNYWNRYGYIIPDTDEIILPIHALKIIKPMLNRYF